MLSLEMQQYIANVLRDNYSQAHIAYATALNAAPVQSRKPSESARISHAYNARKLAKNALEAFEREHKSSIDSDKDYPYIRAYGFYRQIPDALLQEEINRARRDEAPQDAVYWNDYRWIRAGNMAPAILETCDDLIRDYALGSTENG